MARTARHFVPLDVNYFLDHRVLEAGDAWQLHIAAMLAAKSMLLDGRLTRRQLTRVAPESLPDVASAIAKLIEVGLFIEDPVDNEVITIRSWGEWNDSAADIEVMSKGGKKGNHLRHHVRKGVVKDDCDLCMGRDQSPPDRVPDSAPDPREDVDPDVDAEKTSLAPKPPAVVAGDELLSAILDACGIMADEVTGSSRGAYLKASAELRSIGATPDDIGHRAERWRLRYDRALTPSALARHWAELADAGPSFTDPTDDEPYRGSAAEWHQWGLKRSAALSTLEELQGATPAGLLDFELEAAEAGWHKGREARLAAAS